MQDAASLGLLGCALVLTALFMWREFRSSPSAPSPVMEVAVRPDINLVGHVLGPDTAAVAIAMFADFQCPYCAEAQGLIKAILTEYPGKVKVLYRHLPLSTIHPRAWEAAVASECAADQEDFPAYHDLLFARQDSLGLLSWHDYAVRAGVRDLADFDRCVAGQQDNGVVERDVLLARELGLDITPTFIIGDKAYRGLPPLAWLHKQVAESWSLKALLRSAPAY